MNTIHYAGDTFRTGTAIAEALLGYARELAESGAADTVRIPILAPDGTASASLFLVGPNSQMVTCSTVSDAAEVRDDDLMVDLFLRTENVRRYGTPQPRYPMSDPLLPEDDQRSRA